MNKGIKLLAAVAAGAVAGIAAGILLAPDKGSETRRKIVEGGKKFSNELKNKYEQAKEKFECAEKDQEKNAGKTIA